MTAHRSYWLVGITCTERQPCTWNESLRSDSNRSRSRVSYAKVITLQISRKLERLLEYTRTLSTNEIFRNKEYRYYRRWVLRCLTFLVARCPKVSTLQTSLTEVTHSSQCSHRLLHSFLFFPFVGDLPLYFLAASKRPNCDCSTPQLRLNSNTFPNYLIRIRSFRNNANPSYVALE